MDRAGDLARNLREILWLVGAIAGAFGAFMYWNLRPIRSDLELIKRDVAHVTRLMNLNSTLWVEPDSASREVMLRQLRDLRRFYGEGPTGHP